MQLQEGDFEMKHIDKAGSPTFNVAIAPFSLSILGDGSDAFWNGNCGLTSERVEGLCIHSRLSSEGLKNCKTVYFIWQVWKSSSLWWDFMLSSIGRLDGCKLSKLYVTNLSKKYYSRNDFVKIEARIRVVKNNLLFTISWTH